MGGSSDARQRQRSGQASRPRRAGRAVTDLAVPGSGPGGPAWRSDMALAVAAQLSAATGGMLLLVHVRICDSPVPGAPACSARKRPETPPLFLTRRWLAAWADGVVRAATAVVNAARADVARAIARHAAGWGADVIVMTREPRPAVSCLLLGSGVPDQVIREAHCPVVAVRPALRPAGAKAGHRIADRISHGRFSRHGQSLTISRLPPPLPPGRPTAAHPAGQPGAAGCSTAASSSAR